MTDPARTPPPALTPKERQEALLAAQHFVAAEKTSESVRFVARALLDAERRYAEDTLTVEEASELMPGDGDCEWSPILTAAREKLRRIASPHQQRRGND